MILIIPDLEEEEEYFTAALHCNRGNFLWILNSGLNENIIVKTCKAISI